MCIDNTTIYIIHTIYIYIYIYMLCPSERQRQWMIWLYTQDDKVGILKVYYPKICDNLSNILILALFEYINSLSSNPI